MPPPTEPDRQHQRGAGDDEPGVDLLALDDVAFLKGFVEAFLRRVFCFVFGILGHRCSLEHDAT